MSKLTDLFEGVIIATDKFGRNKVRFCESIQRREKLLTKQGFTIHEKVMFLQPLNKVDGLRYLSTLTFTHSDSYNVVQTALKKKVIDQKSIDLLKEIANRPKRNTDITTEQVMNIVGNVV